MALGHKGDKPREPYEPYEPKDSRLRPFGIHDLYGQKWRVQELEPEVARLQAEIRKLREALERREAQERKETKEAQEETKEAQELPQEAQEYIEHLKGDFERAIEGSRKILLQALRYAERGGSTSIPRESLEDLVREWDAVCNYLSSQLPVLLKRGPAQRRAVVSMASSIQMVYYHGEDLIQETQKGDDLQAESAANAQQRISPELALVRKFLKKLGLANERFLALISTLLTPRELTLKAELGVHLAKAGMEIKFGAGPG